MQPIARASSEKVKWGCSCVDVSGFGGGAGQRQRQPRASGNLSKIATLEILKKHFSLEIQHAPLIIK